MLRELKQQKRAKRYLARSSRGPTLTPGALVSCYQGHDRPGVFAVPESGPSRLASSGFHYDRHRRRATALAAIESRSAAVLVPGSGTGFWFTPKRIR